MILTLMGDQNYKFFLVSQSIGLDLVIENEFLFIVFINTLFIILTATPNNNFPLIKH
jgi:hypothetical protein